MTTSGRGRRRRGRWLVAGIAAAVIAITAVVLRSGTAIAPSGCAPVVAAGFESVVARARVAVGPIRAAFGAPAASVAVSVRGKVVWSEGFGEADVDRHAAACRDTVYRIGSISKALTATALAQLVAAGKVDPDVAIQRYVPSFPDKGRTITLRQLAGHLGAIRHYEGDEFLSNVHYGSVTDALRVFADDPLIGMPGDAFSYSSYGYNLIGAAIETAAGEPYLQYVSEHVLRPAAMNRTFADDAAEAKSFRAPVYRRYSEADLSPAPPVDLSNKYPAGGFDSTAEDLARFGGALVEGRLVDRTMRTTMFTTQKTTSGTETGYGWGFEIHPDRGYNFLAASGQAVGGSGILIIEPDQDVVLAILMNADRTDEPPAGEQNPLSVIEPFLASERRVVP